MNTSGQSLAQAYLKPAELVTTEKPTLVCTVLGSCVAVTLFSPPRRLGAICHAVLPRGGDSASCRYVDGALRRMLSWFREKGLSPGDLEAKMFGGADMFSDVVAESGPLNVGRLNIETARQVLADNRIRIVAQDVGGYAGRKIFFRTDTGEVWHKHLKGGGSKAGRRGF